MAMNPMQRKAHNSFLLGMLITLLITGIIIAVLIMQLIKVTNEQKAKLASLKKVYVISQDISSGDEVTVDKLKLKEVDSTTIPANALSAAELEQKINITDDEGNLIKKVSVIAKIDLKTGTIITTDMIAESGELTADLRRQEYNMIQLQSQIKTGDYIDVRLRLPDGTDYIVLPHKKVEIANIDGYDSINNIWLNLNETEILTMSCAIVQSYQIVGSLLYANTYVEAGLQEAATATYLPSDKVINLIAQDPNCVIEAKNALIKRYNDAKAKGNNNERNPIDSALNQNAEDALDNITEGVENELDKMQEERQKYLESLGGNY